MKKKLLASLLLVCVLLAGLTLTAHAEARLDYVNDYAGILTADERDALNTRAAQVSEAYGFPVYIVTVYDHTEYVKLHRGGLPQLRARRRGDGGGHHPRPEHEGAGL